MSHPPKSGASKRGAKLNVPTSVRTAHNSGAECTHSSVPAQVALNAEASAAQPQVTPTIFVRTERPVSALGTWRLRAALALQESFDELEAEGHAIYTKRALAARCGVDEKIVRKWCLAEKTIPAGSLPLWWEPLRKLWLRKMGIA